MDQLNIKKGFYRIELNKAVWDVPEKYTKLSPIGMGAYGQVWWVPVVFLSVNNKQYRCQFYWSRFL